MDKEKQSIIKCISWILIPYAICGILIQFKSDLLVVLGLMFAVITMISIWFWFIASTIKGFKNIGQNTMLILIFDMLVFILAYMVYRKNGLYVSMMILPIVTNIYVNVKIIYSKNAQ
ncbi:MAG: hypothetical protein Q8936_23415 [Bacillota bacterium]|nr:hypothetical protein [Bacillota bacterium]